MAGLNTKSGQRNAPSPYSANASKAPVPKQNPGGGTTLENRNNPQFLKPKPGTSEISARIPVEPIDEMRRREKEDFDYYSQFVQQNRGQAARDNSSFKSQDANTNTQAATASNLASQELQRMQGTVANQINARDNFARINQQIISDDGQLQRAKIADNASLRTMYSDNLKSLLGYGAARGAQNYEYWR